MPLVEIKNIYKIYNPGENEVRALNGINLSIDKGEFVAIVGHSGSGKSTMMNMLGCLDVPTSGEYFLEGENVATLDDDELSDIRNKQIGFIFQGFNLIPSLNALENVELPLIYRGLHKEERKRLSKEALIRVGLETRMTHRPMQLSGGQQQRVAIARAIAARPPILLADEPTGNLDSKSGVEVMKILRELWYEGRTIILITHDNEIADTAHRVVRFKDGIIIEDKINENIVKLDLEHYRAAKREDAALAAAEKEAEEKEETAKAKETTMPNKAEINDKVKEQTKNVQG